jgi:hypothetical protein
MEPVAPTAQADESSDLFFHCQPRDESASPLQRTLIMLAVGAILGAVGWYEADHTFTWQHISAWLIVGIALFSGLAIWAMRNPVLSIGIGEDGLTIIRLRGPLIFAWSEIEAARLQDYPIVKMHTTITCLLIRAHGENFELVPDFDPMTQQEFAEAIGEELSARNIPAISEGLRSFDYMLSQSGAWVFVVSIIGILIAHAMGYRTLGTVFGLGLLFTGSVLALMTHHQRTSKVILAATLALILGATAILWTCHVNVREVLNKWEWTERQVNRPVNHST